MGNLEQQKKIKLLEMGAETTEIDRKSAELEFPWWTLNYYDLITVISNQNVEVRAEAYLFYVIVIVWLSM